MESIIISVLIAAFAYFDGLKTKKQLLIAINSIEIQRKYQEWISAGIKDFQTKDKKLLKSIQQELIQKGQVDLARKMNDIIDDEYKISQESFILLESYLESDKLYTVIINNSFLPSE